ncbi:hypothetical protein EY643_12870 [Halioglobus maricola]|uniref:Uncharacterized protein n=1 Tax=Halioglobus maricola TaxID=2601894 RepID=A0A5P9NLI0_9GAMM|nr:hypothetical protein [Halioglobus maricola]QFU76479.1 hypothetical protein EY643_12870 [Halioglobus maricola]
MRALLAILAVTLSMSVSAEDNKFCAWAQGVIAETSLEPAVSLYEDYDAFVESKPFDDPFTVHQYFSSHLAGEGSGPTVVSCKMRTPEQINRAHVEEGSETRAAGTESSCDEIHRQMLDKAYANLGDSTPVIPRASWTVTEEEVTYMGPSWLEPWPFTPVEHSRGRFTLLTRALYAPNAWWIPMPERFLGNYYCHLVAPSYLDQLIRGRAAP